MSDNANPFGQPGNQPNATPTSVPPSPFAGQPTNTSTAVGQASGVNQPVGQMPMSNPAPASNATGQPVGAGPFNNIPTTPNNFGQPVQPKKSGFSKKMVIGIVGGVVAMAIIVVVLLVVFVAGRVTADDYDQALDKLTSVNETANDIDSDIDFYSLESGDTSELDDMVDQVNQAISDGQTQIDELGKMKAITSDEDAKKLFDDLNSKYGSYSSTIKQMLTDIQQVMPVVVAMNAVDDISYGDYSAMATAYQNIADTAKETQVDNDELADALSDLSTACQEYATYFQAIAAGQYPSNAPDYSSLSDATDRLQDVFSYSDLMDAASDVTDAYRELYNYMVDKYDELSS